MFKKAKHWILILLVCVLFIGLIPAKASAASIKDDIQNVLPTGAPVIPNFDLSEYPVVMVARYGGQYRLELWEHVNYYSSDVFAGLGYYFGYPSNSLSGKYYVWSTGESSWTLYNYPNSHLLGYLYSTGQYSYADVSNIIWSNTTIYHFDGTVAYRSDVISDEPGVGAPAVPQFRVNLPSNYVYQYALNDIPAQLYVDAYVNQSGASVAYTWQRYIVGDWLEVDYGDSHSQYYTPVTSVEGTYRYRCQVTNTVGGRTSYAYSNSVYVLVGSSATVPDETISPGDQVIIDQVGQIGDDVGQIKDSIDTLPDDIAGGMQDVLEGEKAVANTQGNQAIQDMIDVIPNIGDAGQASLAPIINAISYTGRDPVLRLPAIVMPAVDGHWQETTLLAAQEVEFAGYLDMIPGQLVLLVQILVVMGVVLYAIKDIYGLISYFATLER